MVLSTGFLQGRKHFFTPNFQHGIIYQLFAVNQRNAEFRADFLDGSDYALGSITANRCFRKRFGSFGLVDFFPKLLAEIFRVNDQDVEDVFGDVDLHKRRIISFGLCVNGFFEIFFVGRLGIEPRTNALKGRCSTFELPSRTRRENRTHPDGFGDLLASLGTLPRISKSNTNFKRIKLNSYVEAIDTLGKPVEIS